MKRLDMFLISSLVTVVGFGASSYNSNDSAAYNRVESLIKSQAGGSDALISSFREKARAISDKFTKNAEVKKLRNDLLDSQEENEKLASIPPIIATLEKKRVDEEVKRNDAVRKSANSLDRQSSVSANLSNGDLEESCRKGVDLGSLKVSADDVSRNTYTRTEMKKLARDEQEKLETAQDEASVKAAKALKELGKRSEGSSGRSDSYGDKEPQVKYLDDNARIEALKKSITAEEKERDWRWEKIFDSMTQSTDKNRKDSRKQDDTSELSGFAAADVLSRVNRVMQLGVDAAKALRNNCVKEADILGRDNPFAQNTLFNSAYETMRQWNASYANGGFLSMIQSVSTGLTCPDVSGDLNALWSPVIAAAETLKGATDALVLGQSFVALNDAVTTAQAQVEAKLVPIKDSCNFAARNRRKVEQFVASISSAIQSAGQTGSAGGVGSRAQTASTNRSVPPAPNAIAHAAPRRTFP